MTTHWAVNVIFLSDLSSGFEHTTLLQSMAHKSNNIPIETQRDITALLGRISPGDRHDSSQEMLSIVIIHIAEPNEICSSSVYIVLRT